MEHRHLNDQLVVELDRGEEVLESLTVLCKDHEITCARLSGIGAVKDAKLGYYDLSELTYLTRTIPDVCELVSLIGNVALVDGVPFIHAHVSLGDRELKLVGGHLVRATVAVTAEIFIHPYDHQLKRAYDPEVKLNLLKL